MQEIEKQDSKVKANRNIGIGGDFSFYHSRKRDCVENGRTTPKGVFVIPGLTRNPVLFQIAMLLDAGSSPA